MGGEEVRKAGGGLGNWNMRERGSRALMIGFEVYNEMKDRVERKIELERAMIPPALLGESLLASNCD